MKSLKTFLFFSFIYLSSHAQFGVPTANPYRTFNPVPSPPSVSAFEKYGNIPVNANTGIPSIQIPIAEIGFNDFKWPISLSYHASGFKSDEVASRTGLGWSLVATGIISSNQTAFSSGYSGSEIRRTLNLGFTSTFDRGECVPFDEQDVLLADNIANGLHSTEPVIFNLNSPVLSAKFLSDGKCLPAQDIKISVTGPPGSATPAWSIIDESGNIYEFALRGDNTRISECQGVVTAPTNYQYYLTKITTVNGNIIDFFYSLESYSYRTPSTYIKKFNPDYQSHCNTRFPLEEYFCENLYYTNEYRLIRIEASNGTMVAFNYSNRDDVPGSSKLDNVTISYVHAGVPQIRKMFNLKYDYFATQSYESTPEGLQLKLNEVELKGENTVDDAGSYVFQYNNSPLKSKMSPAIYFPNGPTGGAVYDISEAGILERISYPTGGYSSFTYEVLPGYGTLRVKNIRDFSANGDASNERFYEYNDVPPAVIQAVFVESIPNYFFGNPNGTDPLFCIDANPCSSPSYWLQQCDRVIFKNTPVQNTFQDLMDNTIRFPFVTEFNGIGGANGKTEYLYAVPDANRLTNDVLYLEQRLREKKVYKKINSTDYSLVARTKYVYETPTNANGFFDDPEHPLESRYWIKRVRVERPELTLPCCDFSSVCFSKLYTQYDLRLASVPVYLMSQEEQLYESTGTLTTTTTYQYGNPLRLNPTSIRATNSRGETVADEMKYAYDFPGNAVYDLMTSRNMVSQPVEVVKKNITKGSELVRTQNEYGSWFGNSRIFINKVKESISGGPFKDIIVFERYSNKGNIEQYKGSDGLRYSIFWGYTGTLPVAKILGVDYVTALNSSLVSEVYLNSPANDADLRVELNKFRQIASAYAETFTYKPLVGMTSETDANGRSKFYEFDFFGRLKLIRDKNGNILKTFEYKYFDQ